MSLIFVDELALLKSANRLAVRYIQQDPLFEIFTELNGVFLKATQSDYGFIARVFKNEDGPFIKTLALSNIAWNDDTRRLYEENAERGMVFSNLDTLFGQVLKTGKTYISHDAPKDSNASGIPSGHPDLDCFLGIPIVRDEVLIGMVGLANGQNYGEPIVVELEPLLSTATQIIYSIAQQEDLVADGNYFYQPQAVINSIKSGVLSVDSNGKVISANLSAAYIFGFQFEELVDTSIQALIPPAGADEIYNQNAELFLNPQLFGRAFEATGASKSGNYFPIEVTYEMLKENCFTLVVRDLVEEKKTERLKNEFISIVSHELRTPLSAVYTALSMLSDEQYRPTDPVEIEDLTQIAHRNCERLVSLVGDILDYEKLNCGKLDFDIQKTKLSVIFENAREVTQILANINEIELVFCMPEYEELVAVDSDRISQVLVNLITNAIKHSTANQKVTIGIETSDCDDTLRVFIQDNGPGIAEDDLRHIFDPFIQIDKNSSGAGLGLAICKQIIEGHESRIHCRSKLGKGTKFSFDLIRYVELDHLDGSLDKRKVDVLWIEKDAQHFDLAVSGFAEKSLKFCRVSNAQKAKQFLNANSVRLLVAAYPIAIDSMDSLFNQIRKSSRYEKLPIIVYSNDMPPDVRGHLEAINIDCESKKSWKMEPIQARILSKLSEST